MKLTKRTIVLVGLFLALNVIINLSMAGFLALLLAPNDPELAADYFYSNQTSYSQELADGLKILCLWPQQRVILSFSILMLGIYYLTTWKKLNLTSFY